MCEMSTRSVFQAVQSGPVACIPQTGSTSAVLANDAIAPTATFAAQQPAPPAVAMSAVQKSPLPIAPKPKQFPASMPCSATPPKVTTNQGFQTTTQKIANAKVAEVLQQIKLQQSQHVVSSFRFRIFIPWGDVLGAADFQAICERRTQICELQEN